MVSEHDPLVDPLRRIMPCLFGNGLILFVGAILYLFLCQPSINQRGWPAIDPFWSAMPWLWYGPLLLFLIIDVRPLRQKARMISDYAIATAFIESASVLDGIPKSLNLLSVAVHAIVVFVPYHWLAAFAASYLVAGLRRIAIRLGGSWPRLALAGRFGLSAVILTGSLAFPTLYRQHVLADVTRIIRAEADEDWRNQTAVYCRIDEDRQEHRGRIIERFADQHSGLPLDWHRNTFRFRGLAPYGRIYNERIDELIAENGAPEWSSPADCVADDMLVSLLDSGDFNVVDSFPHHLVDRVSLVRSSDGRTGIQRVASVLFDSREMTFAESRTMPSDGLLYVGRNPKNPGVTFLRRGNRWLGAYRANGQVVALAYEAPPNEGGE
jgi:hypothetical protein